MLEQRQVYGREPIHGIILSFFWEELTAKPFFAKENYYFQPAFLQGVEVEEKVGTAAEVQAYFALGK